ncbi:MAG: hypothetical protein V4577_07185 [Bacteroidota bacterium]
MKKYTAITLLLAGITISLIALTSASKPDLRSQLIGEWRNVYVKVNMHTKSKPAVVMEADSSNWEKRLGIKPIRTHFLKDGTYYSEYRNLKDSTVRRPAGTWSLKGDSLSMTQLTPDKSILKLHLSITHDQATFHGMIDFDGEGVDNDEYFGIQKKFK